MGGLRPESFSARNSPWLTKCLNKRVTSEGLKGFYSITQPMTDNYLTSTLGETKAWPFPQLFHGKAVTLLCFSDAIYTVDESTYVCTLVDTKNLDGTSGSITAGRDWQFADFYNSWMLTNGESVVFKTGASSTVYVQSSVKIQAICAHKEGRLLMGGFDDFYSTVDWNEYWRDQAGTLPGDLDAITDAAPGNNYVWWSSFMLPDMLAMFSSDSLTTGDRPYALDLLYRNEAGLRPMPYQGYVLGLLPLGDGVVAYGSKGVRYLNPYQQGEVKTYGAQRFIGLPDTTGVYDGTTARGRFAGGNERHIFLEPGGELWQLTPDLQAQRLMFKEHLSALDPEKVVITHEPLYDEFYISDGTLSFLLTKSNRLCKASTCPTAIHTLGSGAINAIKFATSSPTAAQVEMEKMTTPSGEMETLCRVRIVGLSAASNTLTIKYRTKPSEDWYAYTATLDSLGEWNGAITGLEFKILMDATTATSVTYEDVEVDFSTEIFGGSSHKLAASAPSAATE